MAMHILPTALLMFATSSAWADWVQYAESARSVYYLDPATIRQNGNLRTVWELSDLKERDPDGELSRRALMEYDCDGERLRTLSLSTHSGPMATGKVLVTASDSTWDYVAPGTIGDAALRLVCAAS